MFKLRNSHFPMATAWQSMQRGFVRFGKKYGNAAKRF
jgi:hypothetical protein